MIVCSLMYVLAIFALNCWLQIEHVTSDCAESDDDLLNLAFRSLRFLSASQILFASNCAAPLLISQTLYDPVQPVPRTQLKC